MMELTRITRPGIETLAISGCPCCGGSVLVTDCGYSSFNPGTATCKGVCKRKWDLGFVDDEWDAGLRWNTLSSVIKRKLLLLSTLRPNKRLSVSRDFAAEALADEASQLLKELEEIIIGCKPTDKRGQ